VLDVNHLLPLFPFPQLIASLLLVRLLALKIKKRILKVATAILVYSILASALVLNLNLTFWYYAEAIRQDAGTSVAIYNLADYLASENLSGRIICLQGGLHHNIPFLTGGKIFVFDREYLSNEGFKRLMEDYLASPREFYVIEATAVRIPGYMRYREFVDLARKYKRECRLIKIFQSPLSGVPKYYLSRVFPPEGA